jgi:SAM-dependent methyltransferase
VSDLEQSLGRRFARLTTNLVVARPALWRLFRPLTRLQFDRLAPQWTSMRSTDAFASLEAALDALPSEPSNVLDLGTGTGLAAFAVARRYPAASVVGTDIAEEMLVQARDATPPELADRVRFEAADAARLPFLANMIPFFDELERVTAQDGHVIFSFSGGPQTPIWVPPERLREELGRRGFADFADFQADPGTAFLARKGERT